jgi:hypothetical protein
MIWYDERYTRTVSVGNKPHEITVYRKSKTVWVATGRYRNELIEVKGQTIGSAAKAWANAATDNGD